MDTRWLWRCSWFPVLGVPKDPPLWVKPLRTLGLCRLAQPRQAPDSMTAPSMRSQNQEMAGRLPVGSPLPGNFLAPCTPGVDLKDLQSSLVLPEAQLSTLLSVDLDWRLPVPQSTKEAVTHSGGLGWGLPGPTPAAREDHP